MGSARVKKRTFGLTSMAQTRIKKSPKNLQKTIFKAKKRNVDLKRKTLKGAVKKTTAFYGLDGAHKIKIKIIGIGGGAGSILTDIAANYPGTSFFVADTDGSALSNLKRKPGIKILPLGNDSTDGMGTGMNVKLGREAAQKSKEQITKVLQGTDFVIFISCLGGGTGSGAMSVFANIAKGLGIVSYGIFTLPFGFEREKKLELARKTVRELEQVLNAITIIPNERIFKVIDKKVPLKKALSTINHALGFSLAGLIEMIYNPGIINIDFADIKTILNGKDPLAYLSRIESQDRSRVKESLERLLNNPLYPYDIFRANRILFNICGPVDLSLSEVSQISESITKTTERNSKVIFGVESNNKQKGLTITLLAVGCEMKSFFPEKEKEKQKEKPKTPVIPFLPLSPQEKEAEPKENSEILKEVSEKEVLPEEPKPKPKKLIGQIKKKKTRKQTKKTRKNALQIQKDMKEIEKELLEEEEAWETPAFLRNV